MAAGRASLAALRVEGLLEELFGGSEASWSTSVSYSEMTVILKIRIKPNEPVVVFEELVEEFPSEKLKTQLMLIAPVKK